MRQSKLHRLSLISLLIIVIGLAGAVSRSPEAGAAQDQHIYLPLLGSPQTSSAFGVEMFGLTRAKGFDLMLSAGTRWVRRNALLWKDVEPVEGGGYNWGSQAIKELEQDFITAHQNNLQLILIVRGSPSWAIQPYNADCAPVNPAKVEAFARFMAEAVRRYSQAPYYVKYWEVGNEPDAPIIQSDMVYGCWGVTNDPYYGGEAYGQVFKTVATAMKAANPEIKILNGGLLLDRPYDPQKPATLSGRFFEGMLRAGAGPSIDIVSFHSYTWWQTPGQPALGAGNDWRVSYLRGLLQAYNLSAKPLIRTEAALLCVNVTPECRWAQADLVGRSYARSLRDGLLANIWYVYDNDSYHNTAMIEPFDSFVPRPAYFAYRTATQMMSGVEYSDQMPVPGVEVYRFRRNDHSLIVFWSDGADTSFTIQSYPGATATCIGRDGESVACPVQNGTISLIARRSPTYLIVR